MTPKTIDAYIATFSPEIRGVLKKVRATVQKAAPNAKEAISYGMPTFVQHGHLVYFGAFKKHLGLFPPVRDVLLKKQVAQYAGPKGNLQFPYADPIPYALIGRIVKARVKEDGRLAATKKKAKVKSAARRR